MKALIWFGKIIEDNKTGLPSAKRFGFVLSVSVLSCVLGLLGGVICGVTWAATDANQIELARISAGSLEVVSGLVLAAVTTGYVAGKAVERRNVSDT